MQHCIMKIISLAWMAKVVKFVVEKIFGLVTGFRSIGLEM